METTQTISQTRSQEQWELLATALGWKAKIAGYTIEGMDFAEADGVYYIERRLPDERCIAQIPYPDGGEMDNTPADEWVKNYYETMILSHARDMVIAFRKGLLAQQREAENQAIEQEVTGLI